VARFLGPKLKLARREGVDLYLKSLERSFDSKCRFPSKPGVHGKKVQGSKLSDYGAQLREKQKLRRMYGILEKQFRRVFGVAESRKGNVGLNLLHVLESRLDNLVYRAGFAKTRADARQVVSHGGVLVNGRKMTAASTLLKIGDEISLSKKVSAQVRVVEAIELNKRAGKSCSWLEINEASKTFILKSMPDRADFAHDVKENLVVQMFSR
jgi:small subunit ribosomal protein S4